MTSGNRLRKVGAVRKELFPLKKEYYKIEKVRRSNESHSKDALGSYDFLFEGSDNDYDEIYKDYI